MRVPLAVVQMNSEPGAAARNRERSLSFAEAAAAQGARIIVLPELVISGYTTDPEILFTSAEPIDGPSVHAWHGLARRERIMIAGGFCERASNRLYNSAVLVGADGVLLHYRKLHLFDREKLVFSPGDIGLGVANTPFGRVGLCICYDLRFIEVLRALALQGAEIAAVPTAWVGGFDPQARDNTGLIDQARGTMVQANLDQIFVACASQVGEAGEVSFLGSSLIVDPYGKIIAGPLDDQREGAVLADLNLSEVEASQERSPLIRPRQDRRTDLYGLKLGDMVL